MVRIQPRQISPGLQKVRNFLLGRTHTSPLRYAEEYAGRTQPPPELPEGPAHVLSANYYYSRDGRREVVPPKLLADSKTLALEGSSKDVATTSAARTPGKPWKWD